MKLLSFHNNHNNQQYVWPGEFPGQRSLEGYSPWGCKELGISERLTHSAICTLLLPTFLSLISDLHVVKHINKYTTVLEW